MENNGPRDMLWEGAASANHGNLACCLGYPKSFGPLTTLPCIAQCNIEIPQGGIASAPTSQRASAFAALTASIPAAGEQRFSQSFPTPPSLPLRLSCAFQQVCRQRACVPLQTSEGKTRSYSPLVQEALRRQFTLVCEIEHRDQGPLVDASETCNSAAQSPNRNTQ